MFIFRFICVLILSLVSIGSLPGQALAISQNIVISEIQTSSAASGSHEFIELYNASSSNLDIEGWTIEYKSASSADIASSWNKKATLKGQISAYGFYLVAPIAYLNTADAEWTSGMASSAGNVRLKSVTGVIIDQVGYGETANAPESSPAPTPSSGESLERLPDGESELGGNGFDTDNNFSDFNVRSVPDPQSSLSSAEVPGTPDPPAPITPPLPSEPDYPSVKITELLIDPQSPLVDSQDEFIELYNPSADSIDITGYILKAGTGFNDSYTLPDTFLGPGGYLAVFSRDTKLSLVNSGGAVKILDPVGNVIDETEVYPAAEIGLAWALTDGSWDWTLQSTPGLSNVFVAPVLSAAAKSTAKKAAAKKATAAKKASTKKVAANKQPKQAKVKAAATAKPAAPKANNFQPANWLIALLIGLTIAYAIYEFRFDIQNIIRRARGHHPSR